jgi:death on curing protein
MTVWDFDKFGEGNPWYNMENAWQILHAQASKDAHWSPYRQTLAESPQGDDEAQVEPYFPTRDDAIEANQASLQGWGQSNHALLRPDVLEGALARPQQYWNYTGSLPQAAAALAHGVGQSQAFEDGNKRTAYWLTHHFLHENGLGHIAPSDDEELADHLIGYGEGTHGMEDTARMFEGRLGQRQSATDAKPFTAHHWHGQRSGRGILGPIRAPFLTTSYQPEAQGFAGGEDSRTGKPFGAVHPVTVRFNRPAYHFGGLDPNWREMAEQNANDGVVAYFPEDNRDSSAPMPKRTWAIALDPGTITPGHLSDSPTD